jgi:hypothetical protein
MKLRTLISSAALTVLCAMRALALTIPSDGSDGAFNPTSDIVVDLGLAPTGAWDANNAANAGKGRYDPTKWAVVYKYSSVNIPAGVTVTFKNNASHAPVVWLVSGNVVINGTVSLEGKQLSGDAILALTPPEPGPGGYRGGPTGPSGYGGGYGPGGNGVGSYGSTYGNPQILPLVGGSGSGGIYGPSGAGGGAILIGCAGSVSVGGVVNANGGSAGSYGGGGGSGGAIKVIAETVSGIGQLKALSTRPGGDAGRIRIETPNLASTLQISPETIAVQPAATPIIWPADDAPTVRVYSVDGVMAPTDPAAPLVSSADVGIQKNSTVQVILSATNFPVSGNVQLRTVQKYGPAAWVTASYTSGNFASSQWTANVTFAPGFTTLQARATVP